MSTGPADGAKIYATDINTINNKIDEFRNDSFLGTHPEFWVKSPVT
jgi:hypothetical protein